MIHVNDSQNSRMTHYLFLPHFFSLHAHALFYIGRVWPFEPSGEPSSSDEDSQKSLYFIDYSHFSQSGIHAQGPPNLQKLAPNRTNTNINPKHVASTRIDRCANQAVRGSLLSIFLLTKSIKGSGSAI